MKKYFDEYPGTPPLGMEGDYRCSVHYGNTYRLNKAKEQCSQPLVEIDKIIIYTIELLKEIGIEVNNPERIVVNNPINIDYQQIKYDNDLDSVKDIVWMKFTESGYLGVVATSDDINFDIPNSCGDYDRREWRYNSYKKKRELVWKHTSSGILLHQLGESWDKSFVLVFPLKNIPKEYKREDIERAVGNYLIYKNVPIIDFYSHNY